jgi:predicted ester cyclase
MGAPATGKRVDVQLIDMFLFDGNGRVCEHWGAMDALGMMQQLGLVPQGAHA